MKVVYNPAFVRRAVALLLALLLAGPFDLALDGADPGVPSPSMTISAGSPSAIKAAGSAHHPGRRLSASAWCPDQDDPRDEGESRPVFASVQSSTSPPIRHVPAAPSPLRPNRPDTPPDLARLGRLRC